MNKSILLVLVLALVCAMTVSAADYGLNSVSGIWTATSGGSGITGINTNEVRWGTPAESQKSGLRFDGTGASSFNEGDKFLLGTLTHYNFPVNGGTAANGATLKVKMVFSSPAVSPDPEFTYNFAVEETPNQAGHCPAWQVSATPCDDRITFPSSYGEESYQIGDKLYTLKILGFVDTYPSGSPVSSFITEEGKDNTAYLVGTLSSVLVEAPQITLVSKTVNGHVEESAPGLSLYVGDPITWEYLVQNTGNVALTDVAVSDSQETVNCPKTTLAPGEAMTCTASGTATLGQYENTATASGKYNSNTYTSEEKVSYYLGTNPPVPAVCGDGVKNQPSEECEMANTENNDYCPQTTTGCQDNKQGVRDTLGVCNLNCLCAPDSFTDFQCVKGQCGAACAVDADCDDNNLNTADTCLNDCTCKHDDLPYCGDGVKNGAEECDGTDGVGAHQSCNVDCQLIDLGFCGDGKLDTGEECDYNNGLVCTPACDSSCNYCDANCNTQTVNGDACPPTDVCGDGVMTGTEQCDAGSDNGLGCTPGGCGLTCNYCDSDCTTETNFGGSCPTFCELNPTAPECSSNGVPEFSPFALGLAVIGVGLGLALLRKK
jgi:uncharacterized repeat protein (TIGR01451 family)